MDRKVIFNEALFDAKYIKGEENECWFWTAFTNKEGYGRIKIKVNGKSVSRGAHRVSLYRKLVYDDTFWFSKLEAGHTCANTSCVNPSHLMPQTRKENNDELKNRLGNSYNLRGSANGRSKLTEEQVLAIRATKGKLQKQIAEEYGVSINVISKIINRKIWAHI